MPLRYWIVKRSLWLQGLLIVLALSAHDLVMAWDAPVAAMAPTTRSFTSTAPRMLWST